MYNVWKFVLVEMQQYPRAAYLALMSSFITKKDLFVSYLPSILHLITKYVLLSAVTASAHKRVIWFVGIEMCLIDDLNFHNLIWRLALLH